MPRRRTPRGAGAAGHCAGPRTGGPKRCWKAALRLPHGTKADAAYTAVMQDDAARVENLCYRLAEKDWEGGSLNALELALGGWRRAGAVKGGKDSNQAASAASELRDRAKKQLESLRKDALLCTGEEFAADRRRAAPLVAALVRAAQTFADSCFAAKCARCWTTPIMST